MARTMSRRKKRFTFTLVAVLVLSGFGVAFAFWTSSGTGDGSAETGTSVSFTIGESGVPEGTIAPGSDGQTVEFTVTNPGPGVQSLSDVTVEMADEFGDAWVPDGDCLIADYNATITEDPSPAEMAAGSEVTGTVTVTLDNTGVNQDDCKDQTVPLYFVAS